MKALTSKSILLIIAWITFLSCDESIDGKARLGDEYNDELMKIAPYVIKKRDDFSFDDRFKPEHREYYKKWIDHSDAVLRYYVKRDTANIFFFSYRDKSSLYEHYQGMGGYYKTDEHGNITFMNLLYQTPRFTKEEKEKNDLILFNEMVTKGNVAAYIGNRKFIHSPNKDFYYDTKRNRWDYTPNSSWRFLQEEQQRVAQ